MLWLVAIFLPWWSNSNEAFFMADAHFGLWDHPENDLDVQRRGIWLTDAFALLPIPFLFVRLAARSFVHEPPKWRRDVAIAAVLMLLALASTALWPVGLPFWGSAQFPASAGIPAQELSARPGFGWFLGLLCVLLLALAWWLARPRPLAANGK